MELVKEMTVPSRGDGIKALVDYPNYTTCLKGDLLVIDDITEQGNWVTKSGWHFGPFALQSGLIELVPASDIPADHVEVRRESAFNLGTAHDALQEESINAAQYYVQERYSQAPFADKTLALNACAHGFYMGFREAERKNGIGGRKFKAINKGA